jgi:hypothetical protein
MKETSTVIVSDASQLHAGDMALIDQTDSAQVSEGDCAYFKRAAGRGESERVQIAAVSGNTLTLMTPLHWTFTTAQGAQVAKVSAAPVQWAGIESVLVQGGRPGGYPGQHAGGIDVANAAYSWVKDVQVDGTTSGYPIRLGGTYRCVVRDSHVHNSYSYGFAQDNYGILLACGSADNLVENNIVRFLNKGILFMNTGGGNVVGYNYVDNSWAADSSCGDAWQEVPIDTHCAWPHMELIEGNWAPHMGASTTHGSAGYLTFFRNYASSQFAPSIPGQPQSSIVWSMPLIPQYGNVTTIQFESPDNNMTLIGNVLGSTADTTLGLPPDLGTTGTGGGGTSTSIEYISTGGGPSIFEIDQSTVTWTSLWATGNFDTVNRQVMWNATSLTANLPSSTRNLPASLYYGNRPSWWPSGTAWPWVDPTGSPKVSSLPAQTRSSAFNYDVTNDASCTMNCGNYCCSVGPACTL